MQKKMRHQNDRIRKQLWNYQYPSGGVARLGETGHKALIRCGFCVSDDDHIENGFCTPQFALVYIIRGEGFVDYDGNPKRLRPGSLMLRKPNKPHDVFLNGPHIRAFIALPDAVLNLY